jgi:predicted dehydrogenase
MLRRHFLAAFLAAPPIRLGIIGTGNRGTSLGTVSLNIPNTTITALCDIDPTKPVRLANKTPNSPYITTDHRQLLDRSDVDAVLIATPEQTHASIAIDALNRGKAVLSEVAAAVTIEECWQLVEAVERTRGFYMMAENCCYYRSNLAVLAMAQAGLFGEITYADCAYLHSLPGLGYTKPGQPTWRGRLMNDTANWYPTHAIGPVAQWLGIGQTDRFESITTMQSPAARIAGVIPYQGDANMSLIQTARGKLIEIRLDTVSARPTVSTTHYLLQGTKGAYRDAEGQKQLWLEGTHKENAWGDWAQYEDRFEHPMWRNEKSKASATGHGGADWFTLRAFFEAVALKRPSPIDVYSSVEWSSIIALSTLSVKAKSQPQTFPNFRRNQKPL